MKPLKSYFPGCSCYRKFKQQKKTWIDAETACESIGAHLAVITSDQENAFLHSRDGWIGLNDRVKEGKWVWVDGSVFNYTNWGSDQPDNENNEDCVFKEGAGNWNDLDCTKYHRAYICETPAP